MKERPVRVAGIAMLWQFVQMGGVKAIYTFRLLALAVLLTPSDFGLIAIAISGASFLNSLTNLGLSPALVQAENLEEENFHAAWTMDLARAIGVTALTIAFTPLIAAVFDEPLAVPFIQALAFRSLLESLISIKVVTLNRSLSFRPLAVIKIVEAILNTVISISLAKTLGVWAMVLGVLGGTLSMVIISYIIAPYRPKIFFQWKAVRSLLKFGRWIFISGFIALIGSYGLRIIISRELGASALGLYFLAAQLAFLPSDIASEVVGSVAFPLFARLQSDLKQAARAFEAILTGLMALLYPMCALIFVLSPVLAQEVLGPKWYDTVPLIRILVLATMIGLVTDATVPLVKGFGQPYRVTLIELVQSSSIILMIWLFAGRFGVLGTAYAWLPTAVLVQLLCFWFIKEIFQNSLKEVAKPLFAIILSTAAGAAISALVISILQGIPGLFLAGVLALLVTGSILWIFDQRYSLGLTRIIVIAFPQVASFLKIKGAEVH